MTSRIIKMPYMLAGNCQITETTRRECQKCRFDLCIKAGMKAGTKAGMKTSDIDLWEINEAFSSVCLWFMDQMGIDHSMTNVNGGAIAFGHPLGATGAMLLGTMLDELERRDLNTALITLCVGAGMGTSTIIERV